MPSTGFNYFLSYSAVEHQSQKEDFLLFHVCPKYCKWNCSTVRLWLCMNLQLTAIECTWLWDSLFLVLIYMQELKCQHFAHPEPWAVKSHMPQIMYQCNRCNHVMSCEAWRDDGFATPGRGTCAGFGKETDSMERKTKIIRALFYTLKMHSSFNSSWWQSYLGRATEGRFWAGKHRWWILLGFDCGFHMMWMVHTSTTAFFPSFSSVMWRTLENNYKPIITAKREKTPIT